jgi:FkbH-like protein
VHWGSKSSSVSSILHKWNVNADSVVFVDDSQLELAEVKAVHPEVECIQFPRGNAQEFLEVWKSLRDLFGKPAIQAEDTVRSSTLRTADMLEQQAGSEPPNADDFLKGLQGELVFELSTDTNDVRALELVNKTNQFNINGRRHTESSWRRALSVPGVFLLTATYRDRFGPLGKIAVVQGRVMNGSCVEVDCWVMSCRAFSRRIEFACLARLFEQFGAEKILIAYQQTARNSPVVELWKVLGCGTQPPITITSSAYKNSCPRLFHRIEVRERLTAAEV